LSPLNPLRQPTARAATVMVHLAFRAASRLALAGNTMRLFRPPLRPVAPNALENHVCEKLFNTRKIRHHA
jgi:hypothetical protein